MVGIDLDSATLVPLVGGPSCDVTVRGNTAYLTTREIKATGSVKLTGLPGDDCGDWKLGFCQLQFIETNRARYRGVRPVEGSTLVTRDRDTRPTKLCRDTLTPGAFFYYDLHLLCEAPRRY